MKKIIFILLTVLLLSVSVSMGVMAEGEDIRVFVDGQEVFFDVPPQIIDGRTMVPIRAIFEAMGAEVSWSDETKTATSVRDGVTAQMTLDQTVMYVNGAPLYMDVSPVIVDSRILAPARYVAESFGATVVWDQESRCVNIYDLTEEPIWQLYANDGRVIEVRASEVDSYLAVGWFLSEEEAHTVTLYAADGRTIAVQKSEVPAYLAVGWYQTQAETQQTLYAADGRTITVHKSEVPAYLAVGWYESLSEASAANRSSSGSSGTSSSSAPQSGTVYVTKTGQKYHESWCPTIQRSTGLRAMSVSEAQSKGYGACKVCH